MEKPQRKRICEGHAKAGNTYLLQDSIIAILHRTSIAKPIQIWTRPFMANLPKRSILILSKTQLFHTLTSLPLGSNTEASLSPTLKCQPKGVLDYISHNPTNTLHQRKPYILLELTIYEVISLRVYLTIPGSNQGKYLRFPPWFMVP